MDVTSPGAAGLSSRPSASARPAGGASLTLRRIGIALSGVGVAALGGVACVLSFDDLRDLAIRGEADPNLAYLYPAGFDALLAVALISVLLLRTGRVLVRLQAGAVLVLLLAAAVAVDVAGAMRAVMDLRQAAILIAAVPWAMLALALWLWLLMIKHAQARRESADRALPATGGHDIVPFAGPPAGAAVPAASTVPAVPAGSAVSGVPTTVPAAHVSAPAVAAPAAPVVPSFERQGTPEPQEPQERTAAAEERVAAAPRPLPPRQPDMELRWGDIIRESPRRPKGDVLVHPRPEPAGAAQDAAHPLGERVETWDVAEVRTDAPWGSEGPRRASGDEGGGEGEGAGIEISERDQDTQPLRTFGDQPRATTSARDAAADATEGAVEDEVGKVGEVGEADVPTEPHPTIPAGSSPRTPRAEAAAHESAAHEAPPSGRMRSTPRPPEDADDTRDDRAEDD
ncbi:hypothetical protein HNP84_008528 [Thermocatellispora tengchongensis]|uniref:DUF2637 domain-containing protein n=1 Tax=Thermocatellispora tengchongensis TaxID=1073253 RepID=A0A840PM90_9ACTN|nr:DUF2637 domain-containing protein [Thermocatellispora tengchongensis]MBB5138770.1 hypothetical protein [Thermocatellispora tengchongensis]